MKAAKILFMAIALLASSYACTDNEDVPQQETPDTPDEPDTPDTPDEPDTPQTVFTLSMEELYFEADGGTYNVSYQIENPIDGESISIEDNIEWLAVSESSSNTITFTAEKNTLTTEREGEVVITYGNVEPVCVVVHQKAATSAPTPSGLSFELNFSDVAHSSFILQIIPSDASKSFYFSTMEKSLYDSFENDEAIYEYEMERMRQLADDIQLTFAELLKSQIFKGEKWQAVNKLKPETEYVSFVFGLTANAELTSDITSATVTTAVEPLTDMHFDISVSEYDLTMNINIVPKDKNQPYRWNLYTADDIARLEQKYDCEGVAEVYRSEVAEEIATLLSIGVSAEEYYSGYTNKGSIYGMEWDAEPETTYYIVATAINQSLKPGAVTIYEHLTDKKREFSDNEIEVELGYPSATTLQISASTTNIDPYVALVVPTAECEGLDDDSLYAHIKATYSEEELTDHTYEGGFAGIVSGLQPATAYTCVAFGYKNGEKTTKYIARSASVSTLAE